MPWYGHITKIRYNTQYTRWFIKQSPLLYIRFLIVYYSYAWVKFVNLIMMWIVLTGNKLLLWPSFNLKVVLDRQTCPQRWFRLYTKKYFAAIIILEDNLFSTDKDRKNAILSKYDKKSSDRCIFSQTQQRYVHP